MIKILDADLRQAFEDAFDRKPTAEEMSQFKDYVENDIHEWLKDNAKNFQPKE